MLGEICVYSSCVAETCNPVRHAIMLYARENDFGVAKGSECLLLCITLNLERELPGGVSMSGLLFLLP